MNRSLSLFFVILLMVGCSSQESADFQQAQKSISQGHYRIALDHLDKVIKRNSNSKYALEAAREAARIAYFEIKDFNKAVLYHHFIILNSKDETERLESQKQISSIYFNDLQNYQQAIIEFSRLLQLQHNDLEESQYRMTIARAHYYLNSFFQAESEIDEVLKLKSDDNITFGALMLKGNILVAKKNFTKAVEIFKSLILKFPEKAKAENVALILAVCYEESDDYKSAIELLEQQRATYKPPEYIDLRVKRLRERMKNAPGAKGFRK